MANTFHLSLDVPDLDRAVGFYTELFGVEPAKRKPDYAKFELADPPVALALQAAGRTGLSHLGVRVGTTGEVEAASARLADAGLVTFDERDTTCCYARQDKVWVSDPAGNRWEVYTLLEDAADEAGEREHEHAAETAGCAPGGACCTPAVAGQAGCC
jgi:catechol 2,3-dioxygenase-like lactoylglutathione lyase family enzyme